jgi:hypothetical protein
MKTAADRVKYPLLNSSHRRLWTHCGALAQSSLRQVEQRGGHGGDDARSDRDIHGDVAQVGG